MPDPKSKKKPAPKVAVKGSLDRGVKLDIGELEMLEPWQARAGQAEMLPPIEAHAGDAHIYGPGEWPEGWGGVEIGEAEMLPGQESEAVPPMRPRAPPPRPPVPAAKPSAQMPAWGNYASQFGRK